MAYQTSAQGKEFIASWEGVVLKAYPDPATGGAPWTIGVGHTASAGKPVVVKGMTISRATAMEILDRDLLGFDGTVSRLIKRPLMVHQADAVSSLAFNIGPPRFANSSVLKHINAGRMFDAGAAFALWTKADGKVMSGLVRRRKAERTLFETGHYGVAISAHDDVTVGVVLVRGSDHPEGIRALQADLMMLGLLPAGEDDGDFGPKTDAAVRDFQKKHALTVDGRAGPATRAAIAAALKKAAKPAAVAMFPLKGQTLDLPAAA